jgi:hypothetical protein
MLGVTTSFGRIVAVEVMGRGDGGQVVSSKMR